MNLGTGLLLEEFHVKQKWPVLSPSWRRPPLVESSQGGHCPQGTLQGNKVGQLEAVCQPHPQLQVLWGRDLSLYLHGYRSPWAPGNLISCWVTCMLLSLQLCPTLCDPIDGSPPGSPVPGILQARTLEWIAISFSNA